MSKSIHQPQLGTIRLVEQKLKRKKYFRSRNQLFLSLGKTVMYSTITTILHYLQESNKVVFEKDGSIVRIFKGPIKPKKASKRLNSIKEH